VIEFDLLGVETKQSRAVNEIPTPTGVAHQPTKLRCFSTGVSLTAFSLPLPFLTEHYAVPSVVMFKQSRYTKQARAGSVGESLERGGENSLR
jgi:hypothetical protein